jgi:Fur family ferric uptake transcriptional regulator
MNKEIKAKVSVRQKFADYLTIHKLRKTPERFAILELIYEAPRHFDINSLSETLSDRNFRVSRATIYHTLELLIACDLIQQHQFNNHLTVYERIHSGDKHHHLICTACNTVTKYKDDALDLILRNKKTRNFTATHYSLYFYGLCPPCARALKKREKQNKK